MSLSNPPKSPDQVDALDAAFDTIRKDGKPLIRDAHIADAKAKLSALLVAARIDELEKQPHFDNDQFVYLKDRIKELEKQREAL